MVSHSVWKVSMNNVTGCLSTPLHRTQTSNGRPFNSCSSSCATLAISQLNYKRLTNTWWKSSHKLFISYLEEHCLFELFVFFFWSVILLSFAIDTLLCLKQSSVLLFYNRLTYFSYLGCKFKHFCYKHIGYQSEVNGCICVVFFKLLKYMCI